MNLLHLESLGRSCELFGQRRLQFYGGIQMRDFRREKLTPDLRRNARKFMGERLLRGRARPHRTSRIFTPKGKRLPPRVLLAGFHNATGNRLAGCHAISVPDATRTARIRLGIPPS